jgi:hypothetical protein
MFELSLIFKFDGTIIFLSTSLSTVILNFDVGKNFWLQKHIWHKSIKLVKKEKKNISNIEAKRWLKTYNQSFEYNYDSSQCQKDDCLQVHISIKLENER